MSDLQLSNIPKLSCRTSNKCCKSMPTIFKIRITGKRNRQHVPNKGTRYA